MFLLDARVTSVVDAEERVLSNYSLPSLPMYYQMLDVSYEYLEPYCTEKMSGEVLQYYLPRIWGVLCKELLFGH